MAQNDRNVPSNPVDHEEHLRIQPPAAETLDVHPAVTPQVEDSAVTKAEKIERRPFENGLGGDEPPAKKVRLEAAHEARPPDRQKGIAPIKAEYLVHPLGTRHDRGSATVDDDAAEASPSVDRRDQQNPKNGKKKEKNRGQNKARSFGVSRDERGLCQSRATYPEFSPGECQYGDRCKFEHDLRKYLRDWKREDLRTFGGQCPIWALKGRCDSGFKCRFVGSHMQEKELEDGRKELVLTERNGTPDARAEADDESSGTGLVNVVGTKAKSDLMKRRIQTPKADEYTDWLEKSGRESTKDHGHRNENGGGDGDGDGVGNGEPVLDNRAQYKEPPFLPSEKRHIYFGPETPVLAPLTTQGNLPFRRLCIGLGAQVTYSEMAMSMPLLQGQKSEWALMKAHHSELQSPQYRGHPIVTGYDNSKDFKFGAQIAGNKPFQVLKATEVLNQLCPHLRVIDLNCGCPIDLVYRAGAGSALLDSQSKLEKMLRGMNAVSGEIPVTVKIRTGTKDGKPTALKLVNRLVYGSPDTGELSGAASGVAAITLHGRSRQQRYTRNADWQYIAECAALIQNHKDDGNDLADTIREVDPRHLPPSGKVYFLGNGDCYSHTDYTSHLTHAGVDSVMIARGALIKPWLFEEIDKGQYLDKSATERLALIEQYVRYGLETWGSDEMGVGTTRRFLLEWLSFAYRYIPVALLEYLPPSLQDRPPAWRGRSELETLLGSDNYKDWIKISEMFLGPAHKDFRFEPKHKSNSYEIEAEG